MFFEIFFLISSFIVIFCSAVYLLAYQEKKELKLTLSDNWPGVSIIIPVWNEKSTIANTLDSLLDMQNNYDGEVEFLVIDDHSTDNSFQIIEEYSQKHKSIIALQKDGKKGKSESLNQGIRLSKYEIVGCVDADSYPSPDSLRYVVEEFTDKNVGAVTTKLVVNKPKGIVQWFQHIEYIYSNFLLMAFDAMDSIYITRGPLSLYKKDVMEEIGGFLPADKTPTEDMEITFRIRKAGYQIRGSNQAKVYTSVMESWKELFWQRMRWNRGTLINFWMHKDMFLNSNFGMFGMFIFPTSSFMIAMVAITIMIVIVKLFSFIISGIISIFWILASGNFYDIINYFENFLNNPLAFTSNHLLIMIAVILIYLSMSAFGLFESKEKFKVRYFITLFAAPIFYNPILLFFWVSALVMQSTKYKLKWR